MTRIARIFFALLAFMALSAMTTETRSMPAPLQPADERKAQDALPKAKDQLWSTLGKTKVTVDNKKGLFLASFPAEVKKLDGQTLKISGFMLPLEGSEKFKHFLLSKRTPTCPFCPPGEPNEVVEVYSAKPVGYDENLISVEGKFQLVNEKETGIFFKMTDVAVK